MEQYQAGITIASIVLLAVEQILPHLPFKPNSTFQVIFSVIKLVLPKKG